MGAPEIIVCGLFALRLLIAADRHGQPKEPDTHNLAVTVIVVAIWIALLWWGGFFA